MRLADADALINVIERESNVDGAYGYMDTKSIIDAIDDAPTIEPERKVGKWIYDADGLVWCNKCGFGKERSDDRVYRFCPNCGAKMEEGDQDG